MSPRWSSGSRWLAATVAAGAILATVPVAAWNVRCFHEPDDVNCTDPYDHAQTPWRADPQSEHRAILDRALEISGLPAVFREPFGLTVFASGEALDATVMVDDVPQTFTHQSIRPVRLGARERRTRELSIPAMASLPDFSYTLWDWAAGNELCPPIPGGEPVDCHNYETHIGWLNSNHMVPQARRFYDYLHELALEKADACKTLHDGLLEIDRARFPAYLFACEQTALAIEGVAHHYLQDAWALGHMWERWGGTEPADFGGNRTLGFAIGGFAGSIHGSKAVLDAHPFLGPLGPWDDPMNAPHFDGTYRDGATDLLRPGVGDIFLQEWLFSGPNPGELLLLPPGLDPQRSAMLGCAIDGLRDVYARTAQFHGPLAAAEAAAFDGSREVDDDSCWGQRATNRALGLGCGTHNGEAPLQVRVLDGDSTAILFWALADPEARGLPPLSPTVLRSFQRDAALTCTLATLAAAIPILADATTLASGGLPSIAGIRPNSSYARGGAGSPPTSYADPALPWNVDDSDPAARESEEALNLTFADAHAAERCHDYSEAELLAFRAQVVSAQQQGDLGIIDARCGQCLQQVAPHLRRGTASQHDTRRKAFCDLVGPPDAAFVYTDEDPATFTGSEPTDFPALQLATRIWCGCAPSPPTPTPPPATPTPAPSPSIQALWRSGMSYSSVGNVSSGTVGLAFDLVLDRGGNPSSGTWAVTRDTGNGGHIGMAGTIEITIGTSLVQACFGCTGASTLVFPILSLEMRDANPMLNSSCTTDTFGFGQGTISQSSGVVFGYVEQDFSAVSFQFFASYRDCHDASGVDFHDFFSPNGRVDLFPVD